MAASLSECLVSPVERDEIACKSKWCQFVADFQKVSDYIGFPRRAHDDYWAMTPLQQRIATLPVSFPQDLYIAMEVWFTYRPQITPPHLHDTLAIGDRNYILLDRASVEADPEVELSTGERFHSMSPTSHSGKQGSSPTGRTTPMSLLTFLRFYFHLPTSQNSTLSG